MRTPDIATQHTIQCLHCKEPIVKAVKKDFCCHGCYNVYTLLHQEGLERYYVLNNSPIPPIETQISSLDWLDNTQQTGQLELKVQGIHCTACVWLFEEIFEKSPGAKDIHINPTIGTISMEYDASIFSMSEFLVKMQRFGYKFFDKKQENIPRVSDSLLWRLGISVAISMNVMLFFISIYFGLTIDDHLFSLFMGLAAILTSINFVVGGMPFLRSAQMILQEKLLHVDLPIAVGMTLSYITGIYAYFTGTMDGVYFDSINMFITLMLAGRFIQTRSIENNRQALQSAEQNISWKVLRKNNGLPESIPVQELRTGEHVVIPVGSVVPVAIELLSPHTVQLNLAWITGESDPVVFKQHSSIISGAINTHSTAIEGITVEDWKDSALIELLRWEKEEKQADVPAWFQPILRWYVPIVFALSLLGLVIWLPTGWNKAISVVSGMLIVTCPCAFGIALPLSRELATLRLRTHGIFIQHENFFNNITSITDVFFDKTGTLTLGTVEISKTDIDNLDDIEKNILHTMVSTSTHPKSKSIATYLQNSTIVDNIIVEEDIGIGLACTHHGHRWTLCKSDTATATVFQKDGTDIAYIEFTETVRGDVHTWLQNLQQRYNITILSGDKTEKVQEFLQANHIQNIQAIGNLTPQEKAQWIEEHAANSAMMVGDGVNDTLAFDQAKIRITPANNLAGLLAKSEMYFSGDNIKSVWLAIAWAKQTSSVQQRIFYVAILYNILVITITLLGILTPVFAAIAMPLSSIFIVSETFRAQRKLHQSL